MSLRGLLIGAVLLAILGGTVYWSERYNKKDDTKGPDSSPKLVTLKDDDVMRVDIKRKDSGAVVIERSKSGWQLKEPEPLRTDAEAISSLVSSTSGLAWDRLVDEKATSLGTFGLTTPSLEVTLTGKDKRKQTVQIGDETPTGGGYFAKLEGDPRVFTINSSVKGNLDKTAKDLRDKRLLTFDEPKLTRVELASKAQTIEFGHTGQNEWQIVKPRPYRADTFQISELIRQLREARMDNSTDTDMKTNSASFVAASKVGLVSLTDAAGTQSIDVRKKGEDYFAKSSVVDGVWKVSKELGASLDKGLDDLRNKKLFDFAFSDPSKIEIHDGGKTYSFMKGGEKWFAAGKEVDSVSIQSLVDKLRDLSASKFVETGFGTSVLDIAVTSLEGKRVEKVSIAKEATAFVAKRENEPAIYGIDNKGIEEIRSAASDVKPPPPAPKK